MADNDYNVTINIEGKITLYLDDGYKIESTKWKMTEGGYFLEGLLFEWDEEKWLEIGKSKYRFIPIHAIRMVDFEDAKEVKPTKKEAKKASPLG